MGSKRPKYDREGPSPFPWRGVLCLTGWGGYSETPVLVVGTTRVSWRIEALQKTRLSGHQRYLEKGSRALVPHACVRRLGEEKPLVQPELDLRQVALPFAVQEHCDDCDRAAMLNRKCDRHATPGSAGVHSALERKR